MVVVFGRLVVAFGRRKVGQEDLQCARQALSSVVAFVIFAVSFVVA